MWSGGAIYFDSSIFTIKYNNFTLSNIPPCPGKIFPLSDNYEALFKKLSIKSPLELKTLMKKALII